MKLQKNNKYKNKIVAGLSAIIIASAALTGCGECYEVVEIISETTPEPDEPNYAIADPTPVPTQIPQKELSYEEEIDLLGIPEKVLYDQTNYGRVFVIKYTLNKVQKIAFVYMSEGVDGYDGTYRNMFTNDVMFSYNNDIFGVSMDDPAVLESYPIDENLQGAVVTNIYSLTDIVEKHEDFGFELEKNEYYSSLDSRRISYTKWDELFATPCTIEKLADIYLWAVPKAYRVTAEELQTVLEKDSAKVLK